MGKVLRLSTLLFLLAVLPEATFGLGVSASWGQVNIDNLRIGGTYNLKEMTRLPFQVTYRGESEAEVVIDVEVPAKEQTKDGYEPIPDASWVQLTNNRFILGPGESGYTDVIITVPNDKTLCGKKYQVNLYTHTAPGAGQLVVGVAVTSRLLISISPSEETLQEMQERKKGKLVANLSFKVMPDKIVVEDIPIGRKVDLKKLKGMSLKILNPSDEKLSLLVKSVAQSESLVSGEKGYEFTPDPNFLKLSRRKVKVAPNTIAEEKLYLDFPDKPEFQDKRFLLVIKIEPEKQTIPVSFYVKVFVKTVGKE